jgi:hypothetical protein
MSMPNASQEAVTPPKYGGGIDDFPQEKRVPYYSKLLPARRQAVESILDEAYVPYAIPTQKGMVTLYVSPTQGVKYVKIGGSTVMVASLQEDDSTLVLAKGLQDALLPYLRTLPPPTQESPSQQENQNH